NDPANFTDPLGKLPIPPPGPVTPIAIVAIPTAAPCDAKCRNPGNSLRPHKKCFQGVACLGTRGYVFPSKALNHDIGALRGLVMRGQPERAAQAATIHQLNWIREGAFRSLFGGLTGTPISFNVDWEVRDPGFQPANRVDIVTEAERLFEVKVYRNEEFTRAEVQQQLDEYIEHFFFTYLLEFEPSDELDTWGEAISWIDAFGPMAAG